MEQRKDEKEEDGRLPRFTTQVTKEKLLARSIGPRSKRPF
jgi:hypothetical protein